MKILTVSAISALSIVSAVDNFSPLLRWIQPHTGSSNGGTEVTIIGWSFSENAVSLGANSPTGSDLGNHVIFVKGASEYPCEVFTNDANSERITCHTPKMPDGDYSVKLRVDGNWLLDSQLCGGYPDSHNCKLKISDESTPLIESVTPSSGSPGGIVEIRGKLYTDMFNSSHPTSYVVDMGGIPARMKKPFNGGSASDFYENVDAAVTYGVNMDDPRGPSPWGEVSMKLGGSYVGYENVSFTVTEGYGRTKAMNTANFLSPNGKLYMRENYATVLSAVHQGWRSWMPKIPYWMPKKKSWSGAPKKSIS